MWIASKLITWHYSRRSPHLSGFSVLAALHVVRTGGLSLVARLLVLTVGAVVGSAHTIAMRPTVAATVCAAKACFLFLSIAVVATDGEAKEFGLELLGVLALGGKLESE